MYPKYPYYSHKEECSEIPLSFPPQHQNLQPGMEYLMSPRPIFNNLDYKPNAKLKGKTAVITGGDSGIGRAVAVAFAKEGANVVISFLNEKRDALETKYWVEKYGANCILIPGDLTNPGLSDFIVEKTMEKLGALDILVNNCAVQYVQPSILEITDEQLHKTFATNIFSFFYLTKAALPHMKKGSSIINTASITAFSGKDNLIDYSATKGAIVSFTRSLSLSLSNDEIRVNAVSPGPIWTPLQPASFDSLTVSRFGTDTPMKRAGQPFELAPTYVYLASDDSKYVSGQILHISGGYTFN